MTLDFVQRVIVKFKDLLIDPKIPNAPELFLNELTAGAQWKTLASQYPGIRLGKLYTALNQTQLLALVNKALQRDPKFRETAPNFLAYFVIPCPAKVDAKALAAALSSAPWDRIVQRAYVEGRPSDAFPGVENPRQNPDWARADTGFLRVAPAGIDAEWAWKIKGGDGGPLQFVDIESDWDLNHPELPPASGNDIPLIYGVPYPYSNSLGMSSTDHGTGVLGIVVAADNTMMSLGITPNVKKTMVASYWQHDQNRWIPDRHNAISTAINILTPGDVLLLEMQLDQDGLQNLPVEYDEDLFHLIRMGTSLGVVIIEAAGNGGHDLDYLPIYTPWLVRARRDGDPDSGAILVSAATPTVPHEPITVDGTTPPVRIHNYGSRIDCYAWGNDIRTIKSGGRVMSFSGTSGASAILAGAALAVQGLAEGKSGGSRLSPLQMRNILSDPNLSAKDPSFAFLPSDLRPRIGNTKSQDPNDKIGVMPNLKAITSLLGVEPPPLVLAPPN